MIQNPSKLQKEIFTVFKTTNKNMVVKAGPGSGKTSTIKHLIGLVPYTKRVLYAAFNKDIVLELEPLFPKGSNVKVSTLHGLGLGLLQTHFKGGCKVEHYKNLKIFDIVASEKFNEPIWQLEEKKRNTAKFVSSDLVDIYKRELCSNINDLKDRANHFNVMFTEEDLGRVAHMIEYLNKYDKQPASRAKQKMVSFTDMIYLPIFLGLQVEKYDEIFVDEAQDLNRCQQKLVEKLIGPSTRFTIVGDPNQSIYCFLGADMNSFEYFKNKENTVLLPLSVSYRCPKVIIEEANKIYNEIEAFENNIEGVIERDGNADSIAGGDFVLCRNNEPLVKLYLRLLSEGKKAVIKGRDLGENLLHLIKDCHTLFDYENLMQQYSDNIEKECLKRGNPNFRKTEKYFVFKEKKNIIDMLLVHFDSFESLKVNLKSIFVEEKEIKKEDIVLSTIHKSKGLEADNVFILHPELIPSKYAEKDWELEQEKNLRYVMVTRARKSLTYIMQEVGELVTEDDEE